MEKNSKISSPIINKEIFFPKYIKYPFYGVASNLIDKFIVLGYEQKIIEQNFQNGEAENTEKEGFKFFNFKERPSIINELCNDFKKECQDNDTILSLIFPDFPKLYFLEKKEQKDQKERLANYEEIQTYSIIFSLNPQDNDGAKKSFNCLGYIFYIKKEHRNNNNEIDGWLFYPNAYVILSDYPYFYHFNKICENIYKQMKKETDEIPIDIILYNAIKYCPSPINKNINLSFGAQLFNSDKQKTKIEMDTILRQLSLNNIKNENIGGVNGIPLIFFSQMTGYPFMDCNLSFLFNLLDIETIIRTFIFTFLEYDVIFVSSFPELLNIIIYIFSNLNYPFNDSIYYWHVVSVSDKTFKKGNSSFVDKVNSSIIGICCSKTENLNTTKKVSQHFLVDIDKKESFFLYKEETDLIHEIIDMEQYIRECIPELDENEAKNQENKEREEEKKQYFKDGINLYESIRNLGLSLIRRGRLADNNNYNSIQPFLVANDHQSEIDMLKENYQIQKAFYNFIVQIFGTFYNEFILDDEKVKNKNTNNGEDSWSIAIKQVKKPKEETEEGEEEKPLPYRAGLTFKKLFKDSSKFTAFFINFCQYHECIDMSKIPYSFFNELFYFSKITKNNNLSAINIFEVIDQFYGKERKLDFLEIIKTKQKEIIDEINNKAEIIDTDKIIQDNKNILPKFQYIYNFTYDEFETFYKNNLRAYINREQEDDKNCFIKEHGASKLYKTYKRNNYFLSQKILDIYINYSNNNFNNLKDIFKLVKYENKIYQQESNVKNANKNIQNNLINIGHKNTNQSEKKSKSEKLFGTYELMEISDLIEKHLIKEKFFSCYEMMKFSLLSIIGISIGIRNKQVNNVEIMKIICDFCCITNSLVRRYMNIFLNILATMKLNNILNEQECNDCTNIIISYFKRTNTFPTEDTVNPIIKAKSFVNLKEKEIKYDTLNNFKLHNKKEREKRAEFYKRQDQNKETELIDYIERVFSGWYYLNIKMKLNANIEYFSKKFINLYSSLISKKKTEFIPKTPLELYDFSNKLLFKYLSKFYISKEDYIELGTIVLNLLYYFKMEFFLSKWKLNLPETNLENKTPGMININNDINDKEANQEVIKILVIDIIYILLDIYETIMINKDK